MPQAAQVSLATPSPSTWKANSEDKFSLCKAERQDGEMHGYLVLLAKQYHKVKILMKTRQSGEFPCSSSLHSLADTENRKTKYNTSWSTSLLSAGSKDTFPSHPDHFINPNEYLLSNPGLSSENTGCKWHFYSLVLDAWGLGQGTNTFCSNLLTDSRQYFHSWLQRHFHIGLTAFMNQTLRLPWLLRISDGVLAHRKKELSEPVKDFGGK